MLVKLPAWTVKNHFAELVHEGSHEVTGSAERTILLKQFEKQGWALPKWNVTRFTYRQRKFIYNTFMQGEETKKKTTP